jgi:Pyruvate/2-oxoacid:ferredoxin oxidoreductase delta subunit
MGAVMSIRNVVNIDAEKCDGCGQCATACAEGAIEIVDGKARLLSDSYCDGLGACLGECPQDAITIEQRDAVEFDEQAVERHLSSRTAVETPAACPGSAPQSIERCELVDKKGEPGEISEVPSMLANWPVQLKLLPPNAPYLDGARLLIAADCAPFAYADFHRRFMPDRVLMIGCPKLDSAEFYRKKLAQIFIQNDLKSVEVVYMEVPCCFGLVHLVHESLKESGKDIPMKLTKVSIKGAILETVEVSGPAGES